MAAPLTYARICALNYSKFVGYTVSSHIAGLKLRYRSGKASDEIHNEDLEYEKIENEQEINRIRNVSNLSPFNHTKYKGEMNDFKSSEKEYMHSRKFARKMYAKYGAASGLNPNIMWPSKAELDEQIEDEKEWDPTFQQLVKSVQEKRYAEQADIDKRQKHIAAQMAKMDDLIKDYKKRQEQAPDQQQKTSKKREALLEEAMEHYGFRIEPKSEQFKHFIVMKTEAEKAQKKAERKARRKQETAEKKAAKKASVAEE